MTTTNTETTVAPVSTKKAIVTLKAALLSNDISVLANKIAELCDTVEGVQKLGLNFSLAIKDAKTQVKDRIAQAEVTRLEALERRKNSLNATLAERKKKNEEATAAELEARKQEAENMINDLIEKMGLDLEVAQEMASSAMAKKYPAKADKSFTFNRVELNFNGELYTMPTSGNMPKVWKDRVLSECGDDRAAFILKYAVDQEAAKSTLEQKNGVNV